MDFVHSFIINVVSFNTARYATMTQWRYANFLRELHCWTVVTRGYTWNCSRIDPHPV